MALASADSIISDDNIAARERIETYRMGKWLLRYAIRLKALKDKNASPTIDANRE
jgi:hypothetical protein